MSGAGIHLETDARGIATLALDRPAQGNAYTPETLAELAAALARLDADAAVRVVLLRGRGKHFCVGADLAPAAPAPAGAAPTGLSEVCLALDTLGKPTVALVQGACVGGGVALASCCDVVLAEHTSFFSIPEVRIGFSPGPVTPFFLKAMGARALRRYALSGERFTAQEAQRIGLVHQLVDSVLDATAVESLLEAFLLGAPGAVRDLKKSIADLDGQPVTPGRLQQLQQRFNELKSSPEAMEGRAAFAGKRKPAWYPPST